MATHRQFMAKFSVPFQAAVHIKSLTKLNLNYPTYEHTQITKLVLNMSRFCQLITININELANESYEFKAYKNMCSRPTTRGLWETPFINTMKSIYCISSDLAQRDRDNGQSKNNPLHASCRVKYPPKEEMWEGHKDMTNCVQCLQLIRHFNSSSLRWEKLVSAKPCSIIQLPS